MKNIASELPVLEERYQRLLQHFTALGIKQIKAFVNGELPIWMPRLPWCTKRSRRSRTTRSARTLRSLQEVLMSLDIILPNVSAQPYRVPAKRFRLHPAGDQGALQDTSLNLGSAGEKVKALINEHLISLGINPKVPPVELLAEDFLDKLAAHAGQNNRPRPARWSTPSASTAPFTTMKIRPSGRRARGREQEAWRQLVEYIA